MRSRFLTTSARASPQIVSIEPSRYPAAWIAPDQALTQRWTALTAARRASSTVGCAMMVRDSNTSHKRCTSPNFPASMHRSTSAEVNAHTSRRNSTSARFKLVLNSCAPVSGGSPRSVRKMSLTLVASSFRPNGSNMQICPALAAHDRSFCTAPMTTSLTVSSANFPSSNLERQKITLGSAFFSVFSSANNFPRCSRVSWTSDPRAAATESVSSSTTKTSPLAPLPRSSLHRLTAVAMFTSGPDVSSNPGASHTTRPSPSSRVGCSTIVSDLSMWCPILATSLLRPPSDGERTRSASRRALRSAASGRDSCTSSHPASAFTSVLFPLPVHPTTNTFRSSDVSASTRPPRTYRSNVSIFSPRPRSPENSPDSASPVLAAAPS
mmetsp:Transcript_57123/g.135653  ORF Transcript_57123/g.135653 Transcript_57123/m.135653 type:complete len:381 (+) Transcript_57123:359-1501(+)